MTMFIVSSFAALAIYGFTRWSALRSENEQLRIQVASLKRRLARSAGDR